jgi:hypothetical protein
MDIA